MSFFTNEDYSIVLVYYIFFIGSSVNIYVIQFHYKLLWLSNGEYGYAGLPVLGYKVFQYMLRVKELGHMTVLFLICSETYRLNPKVLH